MELNLATTAVIAVHMQPDIVSADGAFGPIFAAQAAERDIVGVIGKLQDSARGAGVAVIYTRVAWKSDYSDLIPNSPLLDMVVRKKCLVDGRDQAEIVPQLSPRPGDVVVTHKRVSGFTGSDLDELLRARGIDTVLFAGVATNASVEGTARQAADLGYRTVIISDACSAADQNAHDASLSSLGLLAEIATSAEAIAAMSEARVTA
ncbi:MAG: Isochorismatase family protein yecD [Mycobacterium sp.]|nr:Isochorismatase family protein yecD [Mycobacterium sp.]